VLARSGTYTTGAKRELDTLAVGTHAQCNLPLLYCCSIFNGCKPCEKLEESLW